MRIGIIGAGAIGCVVGGLLTKAGHDVTLVDQWPEHIETMKQRGLRLSGTCGEHTIPVKALHIHELQGVATPFEAIFVSLKSYDTEWAAQMALAYLKQDILLTRRCAERMGVMPQSQEPEWVTKSDDNEIGIIP